MDNSPVTHLEWCAGYGGIHIGLRRVVRNLRLVAASEIEGYACANLVAKMEDGRMDSAPIWTDLKTFPCAEFRGLVDIFSAGYPCQPFSHAGNRRGADDPRHLWPFIQRAVGIIRPRLCFFENVEGHLTLGFKDVCHDLDELHYRVAAGIFSAAEVGASHQRKRLFILAHRKDCDWRLQLLARGPRFASDEPRGLDEGVDDCRRERSQGNGQVGTAARPTGRGSGADFPSYPPGPGDREQWRRILEIDPSLEPALCRVANAGYLRDRVDRLRLLGNGVVPECAAKAFVTLYRELCDA